MSKAFKNIEMEQMIAQLEPLLGRNDLIGYAAARNTRILMDETTEYRDLRHDLVMEYGTPEKGDDGNETGRYELRFDSPNWPAYEKEITEWAMLEHEPDVYKIPAKSAIGQLTGKEMLDLEWMLEFEDEDA